MGVAGKAEGKKAGESDGGAKAEGGQGAGNVKARGKLLPFTSLFGTMKQVVRAPATHPFLHMPLLSLAADSPTAWLSLVAGREEPSLAPVEERHVLDAADD